MSYTCCNTHTDPLTFNYSNQLQTLIQKWLIILLTKIIIALITAMFENIAVHLKSGFSFIFLLCLIKELNYIYFIDKIQCDVIERHPIIIYWYSKRIMNAVWLNSCSNNSCCLSSNVMTFANMWTLLHIGLRTL